MDGPHELKSTPESLYLVMLACSVLLLIDTVLACSCSVCLHSYAGLSLRSSLTLGSTPHAGQQMKRKLLSVLRLRCRAIFLDLKVRELLLHAQIGWP